MCSSLERISIPESVTTIPEWCFDWCQSLCAVEFGAQHITVEANVFYYANMPKFYFAHGNSTTVNWNDSNPPYELFEKHYHPYCEYVGPITTEPQCHVYGKTVYQCPQCDKEIVLDTVDYLNHIYTNDGYCQRCGKYDARAAFLQIDIPGATFDLIDPSEFGDTVDISLKNSPVYVYDPFTGEWKLGATTLYATPWTMENGYMAASSRGYQEWGSVLFIELNTPHKFTLSAVMETEGSDSTDTLIGVDGLEMRSSWRGGAQTYSNLFSRRGEIYSSWNQCGPACITIQDAKTFPSSSHLVSFRISLPADYAFSGQCGDNAYWSFDQSTGKLSVTGYGPMWDECSWEHLTKAITSVDIAEGITTLGDYAFADVQLTTIKLPSTLKEIGMGAFFGCPLTSIDIPDGVTSISYFAFGNCESLESIRLPRSLTIIDDWVFEGANSLADVYYDGTAEDTAEIDCYWSWLCMRSETNFHFHGR